MPLMAREGIWTPPHFWALALNRASEYSRASVPMLPVVAGKAATTQQILTYSMLLVPTSLLPWALGFAGAIYGAAALAYGAIFIALALRLRRSRGTNRRVAQHLFVFSIFYLFSLFAVLLISSSGDRWSPISSAHCVPAAAGSLDAKCLLHATTTARSSEGIRADEG